MAKQKREKWGRNHGEIKCAKCGTDCVIDGDFPKFFAWCEECSDYAEGFDGDAYARNVSEEV